MSLVPCWSCGGKGTIKQFHAPCLLNRPWHVRESRCPTCDGSGKTMRPIGFLNVAHGISGVIEESHMKNGVRVVDKMDITSVSMIDTDTTKKVLGDA